MKVIIRAPTLATAGTESGDIATPYSRSDQSRPASGAGRTSTRGWR